MALIVKDRVKQQTTTTGDSNPYTLSGSFDGFQTFAEIGDGNTTYYCCTDGSDFEIGIGTFTASGTTLARTTILQSSNSDAAVNWTSGTRTIFCTQPADKAVFVDENNDVILVSSDSGSGFDPVLRFDRRSTSPADFDNLGAIEFVGRNDADETIFYGTISGMADDMTDGTEDGRVRITTVSNGSQVSHTDFTPGALELRNEQVIRYFLQNGSFNTELLGGTPTANRSITLPDASGTVALTSDINATNVTAAGALMDSEVTNLAQVKAFNSADFATAAQGTTADAALPKAGGQMTGNITFSGSQTVDGRDVSADGTKLDGIESGATADQTKADIDALNIDAATLDGIDSASFLRSDQNDTMTGNLNVTGQVKTTSHVISGDGSGGVALTINDGYGNANVTFNHTGGVPEQNGKSGRIEVNTDSTSGDAYMYFELGDATSGSAFQTTEILRLSSSDIRTNKPVTFNNGVTTFTNYLNRTTGAGNSAWLQQDGTGRVHWYWNTVGGSSPTYTNASEEASSITLNGFQSTGGQIKFRVTGANANTGGAGSAITWIEIADFRHNQINLKKNTSVTGNLTTSGTGTIDGNGSTGGITLADGQIDIRTGTGNVSKVKFYCEANNAHAQTLQAAPHSAASSAVLTLPTNTGTLIGTGDSGAVIANLGDVTFGGALVEKAYECTGTALDPSNGTLQYKTLAANTTFTETFADGESITLMIDDGSSYSVTWPTMTWASGSAPTLATSGYTTVVLWHQGSLYGAVVS